MSDTTDTPRPEPRVYVQLEREKGDQYSILSRDLETIGSQLRGKSHFSIFNSIIVPVMVTLVTLASTSLFQYISWQNSIKLQAASEEATSASKTYDKAASEIDKRYYATLLFQVAVRNIANRKTAADTQLGQYDVSLQKRRIRRILQAIGELESELQSIAQRHQLRHRSSHIQGSVDKKMAIRSRRRSWGKSDATSNHWRMKSKPITLIDLL